MSFESKKYRVNYQIKIPSVRVSHEDQQFGIMPTDKARNMALEQGLDLIEINPAAAPPICIIADFSKFKYEANMRDKENKKKQKNNLVIVKEIRLTPTIGDHDLNTKIQAIEKFVSENKKVQIVMKFTYRELLHKDIGIQKINYIAEKFHEKTQIEMPITFLGNKLHCRLAPKVNKV